MLARVVFGACVLLGAVVASAASSVEERIQRIENGLLPPVIVKGEPFVPASLPQRMAELHVPGVSVAVVHNGKIEWARGYGVAKIGGPPVTPDTLFQAASISKPITALGVLRLVEQGKLKLDEDVNGYLKSWKIPPTKLTAHSKVTLRRLLTHTAGMTVWGFPGYTRGGPLPTTLQILNGVAPSNSPAIFVDTEPGTLQRYSGGGYVIMQQLLVDVTGEPFDRFMAEQVLRPIGMTHSTFAQPLPDKDLSKSATAYLPSGAVVPGGSNVYPEMAPAGLWTTPTDLGHYIIAIQRAIGGASGQVLTPTMAREMLSPQPGKAEKVGLGPQLGGSPPHRYFSHGGSNAGFKCRFVGYTDGDGVAVMTNGDNGGALVDLVIRTVAHEYGWPDLQPPERAIVKVDPKAFAGYVGTYRLNEEQTLTVTLEGGQLFSRISRQPRRALFPMSEREFFMKEMDERILFATDAQGRATQITQFHFGAEDVSPRIPD